MVDMAPMTKRIGLDLTDELHAWIKTKAERERRSIAQEILWLLERLQAEEPTSDRP